MNRIEVNAGQARLLAILLALSCAAGGEALAQVPPPRVLPPLPSPRTGAAIDPATLPPLPPPDPSQAARPPDLPPVFRDANPPGAGSRPRAGNAPSRAPSPRPNVLERPINPPRPAMAPELFLQPETIFRLPMDPPLGYTGPSG